MAALFKMAKFSQCSFQVTWTANTTRCTPSYVRSKCRYRDKL